MEVIDVEVAAFALMKNDAFRQHVVGHKLGHWALHGLTLRVPFLHIQGIVCEQWSCEQCQLLRGDGEDAARLHFCRSFKRQEKNLSWYSMDGELQRTKTRAHLAAPFMWLEDVRSRFPGSGLHRWEIIGDY